MIWTHAYRGGELGQGASLLLILEEHGSLLGNDLEHLAAATRIPSVQREEVTCR